VSSDQEKILVTLPILPSDLTFFTFFELLRLGFEPGTFRLACPVITTGIENVYFTFKLVEQVYAPRCTYNIRQEYEEMYTFKFRVTRRNLHDFFLHIKVPKLRLAHKDPLVGKLNYMSDHVVSLFEYRTLDVRIFKIHVAINAYLIIEDAREARNKICHLQRILKNPDIRLYEREKLARLQHLVRCEFRHMMATEGKKGMAKKGRKTCHFCQLPI
jgi:hypothetical protein